MTAFWATASLLALPGLPGCGDAGGSGDGDGGIVCPDGATLADGICLYECPAGWSRADDGFCHPPCPEGLAPTEGTCAPACPEGTTADGLACEPDGPADAPGECTDAPYNTNGLTGEEAQVVYVDPELGSSEGDGSEAAPYDTIAAALAVVDLAASNDVAIVLGAGTYEMSGEPIALPIASLKILGTCAEETILSAEGVDALSVDSPEMALTLSGVGIESDSGCVDVSSLAALEIRDCSLSGASTSALLFWTGDPGAESLVVAHSTFAASAAQAIFATDIGAVTIQDNRLSGGSSAGTVTLMGINSVDLTGNSIEGAGETGVFLTLGGASPAATLTQNRLSGEWDSGAVAIGGESIPGASVELTDDSVAAGGSAAILLVEISGQVVVDGLRLDSTADYGLHASAVDDLGVTRSLLRSADGEAVRLLATGATALDGCAITGGATGLYADGAAALSISGSAITENGVGVEVQGGAFAAQGNAIGANASVGMKLRLATAVAITGNVLASNYSTGIDLVSLDGSAATVFTVQGNTIMESVGLGLSARSCGDGTIDILDNRIYGTLAGEVTNAGQSGELGDGIGILTGTDGVPSRARLAGNAVNGNVRLGIIVDGAGTEAEVSGSDFLGDNGYGRMIADLVESTPELLYQDQAAVGGADSELAQEVDGVYVSDDPLAEPPVFHGGGGDPTH